MKDLMSKWGAPSTSPWTFREKRELLHVNCSLLNKGGLFVKFLDVAEVMMRKTMTKMVNKAIKI
jgi:hypothetical protein